MAEKDVEPFVLARTFDAPRELVWKAFTEADRLAKWWGPKGFTVRVSKMDLRPGGTYHYCLRAPDGSDMWGRMAFREIARPGRLVWVNSFSDEKGGVARHPGHEAWPLELLTTLTLEEKGGKTTVRIEWMPIGASESELRTFDENRPSMTMGWSGSLDQLDAVLKEGKE
jgi:uncharacterized protein YndB with AHSA1/START domain